MITTHVHTVSSSTTAFTTAGLDVFEAGPTNFTISFSGTDATATYLKFLVKYPNEDKVYTITSPTDDVDDIRTQSISKTFYPEYDTYMTTYTIDVSGLKNDLTYDRYRIHLNLGREAMAKYGNIKVVGSHLYTNDEGSNYCLLTLENENPKFISNVIVPFAKQSQYYLPTPPEPFIPNDNRVLRSETLTPVGGHVPICVELWMQEVIKEEQLQFVAFGSEGNVKWQEEAVFNGFMGGIPSRAWDSTQTAGDTSDAGRGDKIDDFVVFAPEDGIDYSLYQEEEYDGLYESDLIINVTITEIYPDGIAS